MIKRDELSNPNSCMNRAREDELTFVLLERDQAAPAAIRSWVVERIRIGKNVLEDKQIQEALLVAKKMDGKEWVYSSTPTEGSELWQSEQLNLFCRMVHLANEKWWIDLNTGQSLNRNVGELLMLCVSELAEAMEGHRKNLPDDKLPHRKMFEVELADAVIRIFDIAGGKGLDLGAAFVEKMQYNRIRADHKPENRRLENGKKY